VDGNSEIRNPKSEFIVLLRYHGSVKTNSEMPLSVRSHPRCLGHRPGLGHPETPERVRVVLDALSARVEGRWVVDRESPLPPDEDTIGTLAWIHDEAHIEGVRKASEAGSGWLDSHDCSVSSGTFDAAVAAAGLAMRAGLDLVNRRLQRAFLVIRPPSHHARKDRAAGYCFFNAVALAAEVVVRSWNRPVVVADFGALHGDGMQEHFYSRADVGVVSVHRYPAFPGSGGADEVGEGEGRGTTRNVPLEGGVGDDIFCTAFAGALDEICRRMQPAAIILSAGFDAHRNDPLGGMQVSENGFGRMTAATVEAAERWSGGRVLSFLGGGYELEALANSARIHVEELAKRSTD
jgi:acetoin utilization deacetylase AcuC-like enzyme